MEDELFFVGNTPGVSFAVKTIVTRGYNLIYTNDDSFASLTVGIDITDIFRADPLLHSVPATFNGSFTEV